MRSTPCRQPSEHTSSTRLPPTPTTRRPPASSAAPLGSWSRSCARQVCPIDLADALDDPSWDDAIRADGDEALALTGKDVGTPIIHFEPPDGVAFFGPVISRLPEPDRAVELWDHVVGLARFPGFAELKRSLRERPQLIGFGVDPDSVGQQEDWHGGSRRQRSERG